MDRRNEMNTSERYARQIAVTEVGVEGQRRIDAASVLVVGAGGLGCAVLQYLCGAGVGHLVIVDHDRVEEGNLHRQPLFRMNDIGRSKALAARDALLQSNPHVRIDAYCEPLTPANAPTVINDADVTVDAADSFAVTYTLSDVCSAARRPLVSASVTGVAGYVGAFCAGAPSYRAVFPDIPLRPGSCAETGVLGTAVGVVGALQAQMVLALVLGFERSPLGRLISIDFGSLRFSSFSFLAAQEPTELMAPFIADSQLTAKDWVIDLRNEDEIAAAAPIPDSIRFKVEEVEQLCDRVDSAERIVLCCRSGVRAWRAAKRLRARGYDNLALLALAR
jgi:sulfur-carrier protein adenylyltransferase/sulfurtransferase